MCNRFFKNKWAPTRHAPAENRSCGFLNIVCSTLVASVLLTCTGSINAQDGESANETLRDTTQTLFPPLYFSAGIDRFPHQVGKVELPYPGGNKIVHIEDVSPDFNTKPGHVNDMPWGVHLGVSASGPQSVSSAATSWTTPNGPVLDDHLAAVDGSEHLITYYWDPDDVEDESYPQSADWKAIDITRRTGKLVIREQPTSWTVTSNNITQEHIAARAKNNHLIDFSWQPGKGWQAIDITHEANQLIAGPSSSWQIKWGNNTSTRITARSPNHDLIVFSHNQQGAWSANNLYKKGLPKISGNPFGWALQDGRERIAAQDSQNHLMLYTRDKQTGKWTVLDVSSKTNNTTIKGRVTAWERGNTQFIAARSPASDLLLFTENLIDPGWTVRNLSAELEQPIAQDPNHWQIGKGAASFSRLVSHTADGRIIVFRETQRNKWTTRDISKDTGVMAALPLTSWIRSRASVSDQVAVPDLDGHLQVLRWQKGINWQSVNVSRRSAGRMVYTAAPHSGVWSSSNYGASWAQSTRPQPKPSDAFVPGSLPVQTILDIAVSPANPDLVLAATGQDRRDPSLAGVYRSINAGQSWSLVHQFSCPVSKGSVTREFKSVTQIVFAPDDPKRIYAAGSCAIARSTDAGVTWTELSPPGTPSGKQHVFHLAVSAGIRSSTDRHIKRHVVACGEGSLWLSRDDGAVNSWIEDFGVGIMPAGYLCDRQFPLSQTSARVIAFEPGNPNQVYVALPVWTNGPSYNHSVKFVGEEGHLCNTPVIHDGGSVNGKLDGGDTVLSMLRLRPADGATLSTEKKIRYFETGGATNAWDSGEAVIYDANNNGSYDAGEGIIAGKLPATANTSPQLSSDSNLKFIRTRYGGRDIEYGAKKCGEGSIWHGDLTALKKRSSEEDLLPVAGSWTQLAGPPVYGVGKDGAVSLATIASSSGYLVFFNDGATVHVSKGRPKGGGWYRLDGLTPSESKRLGLPNEPTAIHVDPHGIDVSADFDLTLEKSDQPKPFDLNSELKTCLGGRIWLANDGGVYSNDDCGRLPAGKTNRVWNKTLSGLNTLHTLNVFATSSNRLRFVRSLYTGSTHDDDFFSMDNGRSWASAESRCGDCDTWWGDPYQVNRVLRLSPLDNKSMGEFDIFTGQTGKSPDASKKPSDTKYPSGVRPYAVSWKTIRGSRPQIQSLSSETPPAKGDYVVIRKKTNGDHVLMRARNSIGGATNGGFKEIGRPFPTLTETNPITGRDQTYVADVVQAAGGHSATTFYIGDGRHIWRWRGDLNADGRPAPWELIVPSTDGTATVARRFIVNPWNADLVYLIDDNGVRRSVNAGTRWEPDTKLTRAITDTGDWQFNQCRNQQCLLNDMAFDPENGLRRFAAGPAGVFFTANGVDWHRLLDTRALPSEPLSLWFDPITDTNDATLFVSSIGRGILRLHPIPDDSPGLATLLHGGFEKTPSGSWTLNGSSWVSTAVVHSGDSSSALGGKNDAQASLSHEFEVPCDASGVKVTFWWFNQTQEGREGGDRLRINLKTSNGSRHLDELISIDAPRDQWLMASYRVPDAGCGSMELAFDLDNNGSRPTTFYLDDVMVMGYQD